MNLGTKLRSIIQIGHSVNYSLIKRNPYQEVRGQLDFVPRHDNVKQKDVDILTDFINKFSALFVVTGAGISTESGIPDYRSEGVGLYARTNHKPIKYHEFMSSATVRKRYWARNFIGWPTFSSRQPNIGHFAVEELRKVGKIMTLVTQNVDGLHQKAGSIDVVELHGSTHRVICINCQDSMERHKFQRILEDANPEFTVDKRGSQLRPDGDIHLEENEVRNFVLPACPSCGEGILQPDIVFFGANVKRDKVEYLYDELTRKCDSVLVLGSSLQVFSSLRFILRANEVSIPICIVGLGETRADHLAKIKVKARLGEILPLINLNNLEDNVTL